MHFLRTKWFQRKVVPALIALGAVGLVLLLEFATIFGRLPRTTDAILRLRAAAQDEVHQWGRKATAHPNLMLVGIDEASLTLSGVPQEDIAASEALQWMSREFPWHRKVYALAIERLLEAGAAVVGVDLLLTGERPGDEDLAEILARYPNRVVLGANMTASSLQQDALEVPHLTLPSETILPGIKINSPRMGYVNFWPDGDGVVRKLRLQTSQQELMGYARPAQEERCLSFALALAIQGVRHNAAADGERIVRLPGRDGEIFRPVPISSLFQEALWQQNLQSGDIFKNKVVVLGPTAERFQDFHATPLGRMAGPRLHLAALSALLQGEFLSATSSRVNLCLLLAAAFLTWCILVLERRPVRGLLWLIVAAAGWFIAAILMFNHAAILIPVFDPAFIVLVGGTLGIGHLFALEQLEKNKVRSTLDRYVSRNVVREILDHREDFFIMLGGTRMPVTILFTDVRGFTSLSENADPVELVAQLNEYLGAIVEVVFTNQGTVDKFIGDAVMAVWGNVHSEGAEADAVRAVRAALDIQTMLARLNSNWAGEGRPIFPTGIGLNHGEAVFGNIGSQQKMEPTVIGDAVNLASRVEGLTKKYGIALLITDSVAQLVHGHYHLRTVDCVRVAGKQSGLDVFSVIGPITEPAPAWLEVNEQAMRCFRSRDFARARSLFGKVHEHMPEDSLSEKYIERCETFSQNPPNATWCGEQVFQEK